MKNFFSDPSQWPKPVVVTVFVPNCRLRENWKNASSDPDRVAAVSVLASPESIDIWPLKTNGSRKRETMLSQWVWPPPRMRAPSGPFWILCGGLFLASFFLFFWTSLWQWQQEAYYKLSDGYRSQSHFPSQFSDLGNNFWTALRWKYIHVMVEWPFGMTYKVTYSLLNSDGIRCQLHPSQSLSSQILHWFTIKLSLRVEEGLRHFKKQSIMGVLDTAAMTHEMKNKP